HQLERGVGLALQLALAVADPDRLARPLPRGDLLPALEQRLGLARQLALALEHGGEALAERPQDRLLLAPPRLHQRLLQDLLRLGQLAGGLLLVLLRLFALPARDVLGGPAHGLARPLDPPLPGAALLLVLLALPPLLALLALLAFLAFLALLPLLALLALLPLLALPSAAHAPRQLLGPGPRALLLEPPPLLGREPQHLGPLLRERRARLVER